MNDKLEYLSLKSNSITENGISDLLTALNDNPQIKLQYIDLSSNRLSDLAGL